MAEYKIQAGDTLGKLAAKWGTTISAIMEANPYVTNPNQIFTGRNLVIPGGSSTAEDPAETTASGSTPPADTPSTGIYDGPSAGMTKDGVPGDPEVWKDDKGKYYLVYYVPGSDPPVPLRYGISESDLLTVFAEAGAITVDREVTAADMDSWGTLPGGDSKELANIEDDPFELWASQVEKQAERRPWLREPDMLAIIAEALVEGRGVSAAEFEGTKWWSEHNEAQREWLLVSESDPLQAAQMYSDLQIQVRTNLENFGVLNPPDAVVDYISNQWVAGNWSDTYASNQLRALSDPASGIALDDGLTETIGTTPIDTTKEGEETVRQKVLNWLGPSFGDWDQSDIENWAGKLRNDPDAETELTKYLRNQRAGLFPEYDENLTYDEIAAPWRTVWRNVWGGTADEKDPIFSTMLHQNDMAQNSSLLRKTGLARGNANVTTQAQRDILAAFGGSVRGSF